MSHFKHRYRYKKLAEKHQKSRKVLKTGDLKGLSKSMRHIRLMTEGATDVKGIVAKVSAGIVAATPAIVRGGLEVAKYGLNVLDDCAAAGYAGVVHNCTIFLLPLDVRNI